MSRIWRFKNLVTLGAILLISATTSAWAASSDADFRSAYAAAEAANKQAGLLRDQWTVTASTLEAARKAAEAGDFDQAVAQSREAEALAKASIFQALSEKDAWKALEPR